MGTQGHYHVRALMARSSLKPYCYYYYTHTMPTAPEVRPGCNPYRVSDCGVPQATSGPGRGQRLSGLIYGSNQGALRPVPKMGACPHSWNLVPEWGLACPATVL